MYNNNYKYFHLKIKLKNKAYLTTDSIYTYM